MGKNNNQEKFMIMYYLDFDLLEVRQVKVIFSENFVESFCDIDGHTTYPSNECFFDEKDAIKQFLLKIDENISDGSFYRDNIAYRQSLLNRAKKELPILKIDRGKYMLFDRDCVENTLTYLTDFYQKKVVPCYNIALTMDFNGCFSQVSCGIFDSPMSSPTIEAMNFKWEFSKWFDCGLYAYDKDRRVVAITTDDCLIYLDEFAGLARYLDIWNISESIESAEESLEKIIQESSIYNFKFNKYLKKLQAILWTNLWTKKRDGIFLFCPFS